MAGCGRRSNSQVRFGYCPVKFDLLSGLSAAPVEFYYIIESLGGRGEFPVIS